VLFYISLTNHRELSPFDCVLSNVINSLYTQNNTYRIYNTNKNDIKTNHSANKINGIHEHINIQTNKQSHKINKQIQSLPYKWYKDTS
jgi:hypothetical protein